MDAPLREQLVAMAQRDLDLRQRLADSGELFEGYHPQMRRVHEDNAAALDGIVTRHGWPVADLVGEDGAQAAWLVVQHAIGLPDFQRRCLALLQAAASAKQIPAWQPAMLLDRIRVFEGRPQVYGCSFDWDEAGEMSPLPIEEPDSVDQRRTSVGLPPLAQAIARHRAAAENLPKPPDLEARRREAEAWAREVGWRRP